MTTTLKTTVDLKDNYQGAIIGTLQTGDTVKIYEWKWWDIMIDSGDKGDTAEIRKSTMVICYHPFVGF